MTPDTMPYILPLGGGWEMEPATADELALLTDLGEVLAGAYVCRGPVVLAMVVGLRDRLAQWYLTEGSN